MKEYMQLASQAQFNMLCTQAQPTMFYFTKPQCIGCQTIFSKLVNLVEPYALALCKVDVDEFQDIAKQMSIFNHPTLVIMLNGKEVCREVRFIQFEKVKHMCEQECKQ